MVSDTVFVLFRSLSSDCFHMGMVNGSTCFPYHFEENYYNLKDILKFPVMIIMHTCIIYSLRVFPCFKYTCMCEHVHAYGGDLRSHL